MTIAHRGLKVKVKVMDQANTVSPTSIEGSFYSLSRMFVAKMSYIAASINVRHLFIHSVDNKLNRLVTLVTE